MPVSVRDLVVRYAGAERAAVDGVTLDVPAGTLVVIVGPSGCGKSTLLRTVNRLVPAEAGHVSVDGRDVTTLPATELRRGIGYVIQAVGLFPHLTVAENIAVVPHLLRWERTRIERRVDDLLRLIQLDPVQYRARYPRELSGGEAQRVGVARALAGEPGLLLMDEPFGAVDAIVRGALQDETVRIQRTLGTTILFVTHDVEEALRIADRIVVMSRGRVVQYDTPLRVLARPASPYVAELLDAGDAVRRLGLLRVQDAMRTAAAPHDEMPRIAKDATLREALGAFLDGAQALAVDDATSGGATLTFDDVRRALADAAA